jgi:phage shock protein PspC (stress-responsive transcriptional regulator)
MKKTINISLAGLSFIAEEDAYNLLDSYLQGVRRHFSNYPDVEEIVKDIEARFAEQFAEKAGTTQVIVLPEVEKLINAMGQPEQFDGEAGEGSKSSFAPSGDTKILGRKLYRNSDDVIIAGVASGIAAYAGIDPIWVRLAFVLVTFVSGFGIVLYIVLWIIMPEAKTETEKMQMRGEPINLKNLEQTVKERAEEVKRAARSDRLAGPARAIGGIFQALGMAIKKVVPVLFKIIGAVVVAATALATAGLLFTLGTVLLNANSPYVDFPFRELAHGADYYAALISGFVVILIPLVFLILVGATIAAGRSVFRKAGSIALLVLWVVAGIILTNSAIKMAPQIENIVNTSPEFRKVSREVTAVDFTKIELSGAESAEIYPSPTFKVIVEGRQQDLEEANVTVENGTLRSREEERFKICLFCWDEPLRYTIYAPMIDGIDLSGASRAVMRGDFRTDKLSVSLSGASRAEIEATSQSVIAELSGASRLMLFGAIKDAMIKASGASNIDAEEGNIENVNVRLSGASKLYLGDVLFIKSDLSGASKVNYRSAGKVESETSGSSEMNSPARNSDAPLDPAPPEFEYD